MTIQLRAELQLADIGQVVPGTILEDQYGRKATVLDNGYATLHEGGASYPLYNMRNWRYSHIPDRPLPRYTIDVFKQMARTVCYGFAVQHGVAIQPVLGALERIGASDGNPPLGVGMYVHYSDRGLRTRLGHKRGVILGHGDPNQWEAYGEFRDMDGSPPMMGGVTYFSSNMRVMAMDDPDTDGWLREPTEEDDAEVARMRGVMWEIGVRAKRANSWCEAYEAAMSVLGITSHTPTEVTARQPEVADLPDPEQVTKPVDNLPVVRTNRQAEEYPVGAIFEYPGQPEDLTRSPDYRSRHNTSWCWQRRVDGHGMNGTVNLIGPNGGRYGGDRRVLFDGRGQMAIPVYRDLMPHLPIGTVLEHSGYSWTKVIHNPGGGGEWANTSNGRREASATNDGFLNRDGFSPWVITALPATTQHGANNTYPDGRPYPDQNPF
jgi:hypothetical protein